MAVTMVSCGGRKPGDPLRPGFNVFSKQQDVELGREVAQQVVRQVDTVNDRNLQQYISDLGQRLARQSGADDYPYQFTLINDPSINAFALPGGPIFVHSGLIAAADNEAQVAGVLAHEIAHVALRHGTSQASKANLLEFPAALAAAVLGQGSIGAQLGQVGLGLGMNMLMMRYSRSAEEESDALGARLMAAAGYNPIEMARFFEKLEAEGGSRAPQFLSSHPNPGNRVKNVQAEIQTLPQANYDRAGSSATFQNAKQLVARLPQPNPPRQVAAAQSGPRGVAPAPIGGFQRLDTNRFSIAVPQGWNVHGNRNSDAITIAPPQGIAQTSAGGTSVGYGVIAGYYMPSRMNLSLEQASQELFSQLQRLNPSMRVQSGLRPARVAGSRGAIAEVVSASPFGGAERSVLLTVARPEGLFYMVFIAPDQHFQSVQGAFGEMVNSIQFRR
jgi:beta-barrel assembly-enhancing protease